MNYFASFLCFLAGVIFCLSLLNIIERAKINESLSRWTQWDTAGALAFTLFFTAMGMVR